MEDTPHPFHGQFEAPAEIQATHNPAIPLSEIALASIAISLKRLADGLERPCNAWGETPVEAIGGNISRALAHDRQWRK